MQNPPIAQQILAAARTVLKPLVRWMMAHGIKYQDMSELLKLVYLDAGRHALDRAGNRVTISAVSLATGIHRKDVAQLIEEPEPAVDPQPAVEAQVFTRWLTARHLRTGDGQPRRLPRTAASGKYSFERLARSVTTDVHPRAVLDSLLRLGMVAVDDDDHVRLLVEQFVPSRESEHLIAFLRDNVRDHLAAAVSNAEGRSPRFLEQSIFANGLPETSLEPLHQQAREIWGELMRRFVPLAQQHVLHATDAQKEEAASATEAPHRLRFGVFFYAEPERVSTASGAIRISRKRKADHATRE